MTLVEVLLAVALLSLGLSVLMLGASRCLAVMKAARYYQTAQWTLGLGEAEFPLLETNDVQALAVAPHTFDNGFTYERRVEEDADEDGLHAVYFTVSWTDRDRRAVEETVRYVYQPEEENRP